MYLGLVDLIGDLFGEGCIAIGPGFVDSSQSHMILISSTETSTAGSPYQTQALITALRLGRTTWLGSMYDSTDLVDNYCNAALYE